VIDRREGAAGKRHRQPLLAQHVERLRTGHLMDEMQTDEQLRLTARQRADGMRVPDLVKECRHAFG
jgi:hypothetical protein